ncbi:MAG: hypothetical protein EOP45_18245 [Sphingobacteriaceae bacterium]|nr:MAG: hypothetical protein EOP45_18245 [Sphingobacteriaceae bacterium]
MKYYVSLLVSLCFLSSCHSSEKGTSFHSQKQYRHRLFKGGYETIRFKPDGKVYVELLENGTTVKANGDYQRDKSQIKLTLLTGPRRNISFWQLPSNELLDSDKNNRWEIF